MLMHAYVFLMICYALLHHCCIGFVYFSYHFRIIVVHCCTFVVHALNMFCTCFVHCSFGFILLQHAIKHRSRIDRGARKDAPKEVGLRSRHPDPTRRGSLSVTKSKVSNIQKQQYLLAVNPGYTLTNKTYF